MDGDNEPQNVKFTIEGKEYNSLDEVPEPYRDLVRSQLSAAQSAAQQAAQSAAGAQPGSPLRITKKVTINVKVKRAAQGQGQAPAPAPSGGDSSAWRTALMLLAVAGLIAVLLLRRKLGG